MSSPQDARLVLIVWGVCQVGVAAAMVFWSRHPINRMTDQFGHFLYFALSVAFAWGGLMFIVLGVAGNLTRPLAVVLVAIAALLTFVGMFLDFQKK